MYEAKQAGALAVDLVSYLDPFTDSYRLSGILEPASADRPSTTERTSSIAISISQKLTSTARILISIIDPKVTR